MFNIELNNADYSSEEEDLDINIHIRCIDYPTVKTQ